MGGEYGSEAGVPHSTRRAKSQFCVHSGHGAVSEAMAPGGRAEPASPGRLESPS